MKNLLHRLHQEGLVIGETIGLMERVVSDQGNHWWWDNANILLSFTDDSDSSYHMYVSDLLKDNNSHIKAAN